MTNQSPFRNNRYELEEDRRHVYFLLPGDLEQLEQLKSNYIVGTRGTGKTTLLKSLSWKERLESPSLRRALDGNPRFDRYLGVYLKLPEFQLDQIQEWLSEAPKRVHAAITGFYLDLIWLEALLDAVEELRSRQLLTYDLDAEAAFVHWFGEWWSTRGGDMRVNPASPSLVGLKDAVFRARNKFETASVAEIDPGDLIATLPVDQIGALGRAAAERLRELCEQAEPGSPQWHIRICMDEAEVLADEQQLVLNTIVRLSGFPLYFVIAFAAMPRDVSSTLLPKQTLSEADRHLDIRDEMSDTKFRNLTEGVSQSRVQAMLDDEGASFNLKRLLGPLELNRLATEVMARSESAEVKALVDRAKELARTRGDSPTDSPPILELYLCDVEERTPSPRPTREERSRGIRKKGPAVYIALLRKFGFKIRYGSAPMVLQLSDGCIRDFLSQMDELYVLRNQSLPEFIAGVGVPLPDQNTAFTRASRKKRQNLVRRIEVNPPEEVERVVDGLAHITARLQYNLFPPEPGCFVLPLSGGDTEIEAELNVLQEANHTGYLRVLKEDNERIEFRVHTSLAPAYGFSYRGAYYSVPLMVADLANLRSASDDSAAAAVVGNIVQRFSPPASANLFGLPDADD